jgi:hypothetical protein
MIQFAKELYLTGFAIIFRHSRVKDIAYKAGGAVVAITVVEWFILLGISGYVEMLVGKRDLFLFSKSVVLIAYFALFLVNGYFLYFRGHGIRFSREFDTLPKTRRICRGGHRCVFYLFGYSPSPLFRSLTLSIMTQPN